MDCREALDWLDGLEIMGIKLGLSNITELLRRLGDPQDEFKSIHVAGTNGKGSVCAMAESVFREQGYRTGLYTSPHLVSFNERIRVDGSDITDGELARLAKEVRGHVEDMALTSKEGHVTFFEAATAMAFAHFADRGVELAAIEVGMGGRLDATNVIAPLCTVVTRISLEHTAYLGKTVREIAAEKAGIVKPGVPVITAECDEEALGVIEAKARDCGCQLRMVGRDLRWRLLDESIERTRIAIDGLGEVDLPLLGSFQGENAAMAFGAVSAIREAGFEVSDEAIIRGLQTVCWPGRLEIVGRTPFVVFDVSHTPAGAEVVAHDVRRLFGGDVILVLGVLSDKDLDGIAMRFGAVAREAIATSPDTPRALDAGAVATALDRYVAKVSEAPTVSEAIRIALGRAGPSDVILVTGSLYTVGEAMAWWRSHEGR
jgi:dihydrofolate synthase/folylpolyglutamate synthase